MANKLRLEGKVAVITGAASGIGEASARFFVEHGARVVVADIQDELGLQVVESIGTDKATYRHCDVDHRREPSRGYRSLRGREMCVLDMDVTAFDEMMARGGSNKSVA
uniref:Alcohol dehydrogenase n=1 Tax=Solanum tuberosum TaxID=4113 RepID=M1DUD6_SOLTU